MCGAAAVAVSALVALVVRRRRAAASQGAAAAGGRVAHVSVVPQFRDRFELTEVLEQTGTPSSARRRVKTTAFTRQGTL